MTLNLIEAAALLRIHKNTLQGRARAGVIPGAKVGRSWVFIEADLLAYMLPALKNSAHQRTTLPWLCTKAIITTTLESNI